MTKEEIQEFRRARLQELANLVGGYATLGRMLGYRDGAYVAQLAKGRRAINEDFVNNCEQIPGYAGWFHIHGTTTPADLFSPELQAHLLRLEPDQLRRIENLLRSAEGLPLLR